MSSKPTLVFDNCIQDGCTTKRMFLRQPNQGQAEYVCMRHRRLHRVTPKFDGPVTKCGYIMKMGCNSRTYSRRFIVLLSDRIVVYDDTSDDNCLAVISLNGANVKQDPTVKRRFLVVCPNERRSFSFESILEPDHADWFFGIMNNIQVFAERDSEEFQSWDEEDYVSEGVLVVADTPRPPQLLEHHKFARKELLHQLRPRLLNSVKDDNNKTLTLNIWTGTWNMGENDPPFTVEEWIPNSFDIIAVGVQECMKLDDLENRAKGVIGSDYVCFQEKVGSVRKEVGFHGFIAILVFIRSDLLACGLIHQELISTKNVALGMNLVVARASNKGGVRVKIPLDLKVLGFKADGDVEVEEVSSKKKKKGGKDDDFDIVSLFDDDDDDGGGASKKNGGKKKVNENPVKASDLIVPLNFICCHLAADTKGQSKMDKRNSDSVELLDALDEEKTGHVFIMGDLNYRIDLTPEDCVKIIVQAVGKESAEAFRQLYDNDQLMGELATASAFPGFQELASPAFAPTYKRKKNEEGDAKDYTDPKVVYNSYDYGAQDNTTSRRTPSFTDRLLYRQKISPLQSSLFIMKYGCINTIRDSDHAPVYGVTTLRIGANSSKGHITKKVLSLPNEDLMLSTLLKCSFFQMFVNSVGHIEQLKPKQIRTLYQFFVPSVVRRDCIICKPGDGSSCSLMILMEGSVQLVSSTHSLGVVKVGEWFGGEALIDQPNEYSAIATEDSVLLCLNIEALRSIQKSPGLAVHANSIKAMIRGQSLLGLKDMLGSLIRNYDSDTLSLLVRQCETVYIEAGTSLMKEGEVADSCVYIVGGVVQVSCNKPSGEGVVVANLVGGTFIGTELLVGDGVASYSAVAKESCLIWILSRTAYDTYLEMDPEQKTAAQEYDNVMIKWVNEFKLPIEKATQPVAKAIADIFGARTIEPGDSVFNPATDINKQKKSFHILLSGKALEDGPQGGDDVIKLKRTSKPDDDDDYMFGSAPAVAKLNINSPEFKDRLVTPGTILDKYTHPVRAPQTCMMIEVDRKVLKRLCSLLRWKFFGFKLMSSKMGKSAGVTSDIGGVVVKVIDCPENRIRGATHVSLKALNAQGKPIADESFETRVLRVPPYEWNQSFRFGDGSEGVDAIQRVEFSLLHGESRSLGSGIVALSVLLESPPESSIPISLKSDSNLDFAVLNVSTRVASLDEMIAPHLDENEEKKEEADDDEEKVDNEFDFDDDDDGAAKKKKKKALPPQPIKPPKREVAQEETEGLKGAKNKFMSKMSGFQASIAGTAAKLTNKARGARGAPSAGAADGDMEAAAAAEDEEIEEEDEGKNEFDDEVGEDDEPVRPTRKGAQKGEFDPRAMSGPVGGRPRPGPSPGRAGMMGPPPRSMSPRTAGAVGPAGGRPPPMMGPFGGPLPRGSPRGSPPRGPPPRMGGMGPPMRPMGPRSAMGPRGRPELAGPQPPESSPKSAPKKNESRNELKAGIGKLLGGPRAFLQSRQEAANKKKGGKSKPIDPSEEEEEEEEIEAVDDGMDEDMDEEVKEAPIKKMGIRGKAAAAAASVKNKLKLIPKASVKPKEKPKPKGKKFQEEEVEEEEVEEEVEEEEEEEEEDLVPQRSRVPIRRAAQHSSHKQAHPSMAPRGMPPRPPRGQPMAFMGPQGPVGGRPPPGFQGQPPPPPMRQPPPGYQGQAPPPRMGFFGMLRGPAPRPQSVQPNAKTNPFAKAPKSNAQVHERVKRAPEVEQEQEEDLIDLPAEPEEIYAPRPAPKPAQMKRPPPPTSSSSSSHVYNYGGHHSQPMAEDPYAGNRRMSSGNTQSFGEAPSPAKHTNPFSTSEKKSHPQAFGLSNTSHEQDFFSFDTQPNTRPDQHKPSYFAEPQVPDWLAMDAPHHRVASSGGMSSGHKHAASTNPFAAFDSMKREESASVDRKSSHLSSNPFDFFGSSQPSENVPPTVAAPKPTGPSPNPVVHTSFSDPFSQDTTGPTDYGFIPSIPPTATHPKDPMADMFSSMNGAGSVGGESHTRKSSVDSSTNPFAGLSSHSQAAPVKKNPYASNTTARGTKIPPTNPFSMPNRSSGTVSVTFASKPRAQPNNVYSKNPFAVPRVSK